MKAIFALTLLIGMNTAVFAGGACCGKKASTSEKKEACTECKDGAKCEKCAEKAADKK